MKPFNDQFPFRNNLLFAESLKEKSYAPKLAQLDLKLIDVCHEFQPLNAIRNAFPFPQMFKLEQVPEPEKAEFNQNILNK